MDDGNGVRKSFVFACFRDKMKIFCRICPIYLYIWDFFRKIILYRRHAPKGYPLRNYTAHLCE